MAEKKNNNTGWIVAVVIVAIVLVVGGLIWWGYESTKPASEQNQTTESGQTKTSKACDNPLIKGNISQSGEKIYHNPGDQYYSRTQIDESAGERMFCTEDEAEQAGWRHSKV